MESQRKNKNQESFRPSPKLGERFDVIVKNEGRVKRKVFESLVLYWVNLEEGERTRLISELNAWQDVHEDFVDGRMLRSSDRFGGDGDDAAPPAPVKLHSPRGELRKAGDTSRGDSTGRRKNDTPPK